MGTNSVAVWRVHWLRARAFSLRWSEELTLVQYEMQWSRNYFTHQMDKWIDMAKETGNATLRPGHAAFGYRQAAMWKGMRDHADMMFSRVSDNYRASLHSESQNEYA